nr:hypothetical protein [uncultured Cohaesibacter sp.]
MKSKRSFSFLVVASLSIASVVPGFSSAFAMPGGNMPNGNQPSMLQGAGPAPSMDGQPFVNANSSRPPSRVTTGNAHNIRPNPQPSKCLMLARKIGASHVWWGRHVGAKEVEDDSLFFSVGPRRVEFDDIGCFKEKKDCENWLYWKRTEYPIFASISPCRRGL